MTYRVLPPDKARFDARVSDLEDIDELVRIHRSSVLRHAWWLLKDRDLAESVTQDCFLRAFKARALYRGRWQCAHVVAGDRQKQIWSVILRGREAFDSGNT